MTAARDRPARLEELLTSSVLAWAFALATLGALFGSHVLVSLMGEPGYSAIIVGLCVIGAAMLIARRREISFVRLAPVTLVVVLAWLLITVAWSQEPGFSLAGWLALLATAFLAIVVAHTRDTLQTVRATGDVLRVLLTGSLAVEVLSGILLDLPITFLAVGGRLANGGPIEGLFGTRTRLGLVAMLAIITFLVEWRTRSVRPGLTVYSVALAGVLAVFTGSPLVLLLAFVSGLATAILAIVRRTPPHARLTLQVALAAVLAAGAVLAYVFRRPLVYWLNAAPDFYRRSQLWNAVLDLVDRRPVHGWGWFGTWPDGVMPFVRIDTLTRRDNASALNAFIDILLQAGWVGAFLFVVFCVLAVARAWLTASQRRSTVYTWPALILIALLASSIVDSTVLSGFGWFLLVLCATRSSLTGGWRAGLDGSSDPALPSMQGPSSGVG
ncbi:MAG: O-antigen ligase family protein [Microbacterium sp.]|uniref:O-antigen ligase family protein n=1 Tax=Microbacterium sp. TaxID=51671 RepID=UPI003A8C0E60